MKSLNAFRLVVVSFATMGVSACTSSEKAAPAPVTSEQTEKAPENKHQVYQGPLYHAFRSIQTSPKRSACDKKQSEMQSILIEALDKKSKDIVQGALLQKNHPASYLPFQKSYLVNTPKREAKKGWLDEPYSWGRVYNYYTEQVQTNNTPEFWFTIDAYVRSLITNDRNRVVSELNLGLSHEHVENIEEFKEAVEACKTDTRCVLPRFTEDQLKMVSEVPMYAYWYKEIENSYFDKDKRKNINKLFQQVTKDFELHHDNFNSMVTHRWVDGKHTYSLPLDSEGYTVEERALLEKSITSVWNNDSNEVRVTWQRSTKNLTLFHFLFELIPNNRPFVNFNLREIHLFPLTAVRTIAHEFGHVLGFDDHYYTLWDEENCEYHQQTNEEDIMSSSESGDVTSSEWEFLYDQYGLR